MNLVQRIEAGMAGRDEAAKVDALIAALVCLLAAYPAAARGCQSVSRALDALAAALDDGAP